MNNDERGKMNYMREYAKYLSVMFQVFAVAVVGVLVGIELDRLMKMKVPVFTICLTIFASFVAIYYLFRTLLKK
jgi:tetrahydromethanopterin S-methyltransferase subunit C